MNRTSRMLAPAAIALLVATGAAHAQNIATVNGIAIPMSRADAMSRKWPPRDGPTARRFARPSRKS